MRPTVLLSSILFLSSASGVVGFPFRWPWNTEKRAATVCNGRGELCNRSYGNVTFLGAHDSFASSSDPFALARTQEVDVTAQLQAGARMLQGQAHMKGGTLHLCHTSCDLFDGGALVDYLKKVKSFMDANPNEVITLVLTNPESVSIRDQWIPAFDNSGLSPLIFTPSTRPTRRADWPTLGSLINSGKKLVVFLDNGADANFPQLQPEFDSIWEAPFSSTDSNFPCRVDRISGSLSPQDHLHMINHNLNINIIPIGDGVLISDRVDAPTTNSVDSILRDANGCTPFSGGKAPNFVLLDYMNVGQGKQAVDRLNGF